MRNIGARDSLDRALVKQYAQVKTCNFDETKVSADEMLNHLNLLAMHQKSLIGFSLKAS